MDLWSDFNEEEPPNFHVCWTAVHSLQSLINKAFTLNQ